MYAVTSKIFEKKWGLIIMNNYDENLKEINYYIDLYEKGEFPDIKQYITSENLFFSLYKCDIYAYLRVSTEHQDFGRQIIELYHFLKKRKISIPIQHIFFDKYTGKKIDREQYQEMKTYFKANDYLLIPNLSRLGRNWDDVKKEWYEMETKNINRVVLDNENLSVELPSEEKKVVTLEKKMIQDITFSACLYSACQKIQEVSSATKAGIEKAREQGKTIGRPKGKFTTETNFLEMLKAINNGESQKEASKKLKFPVRTFQEWLYRYYKRYNVKTIKELLYLLEREAQK